ncbi:MAG: alpha-glucuronidase family glycosyl hydrolase, partial [Terracidiphilus sp.]
MTAKMLQGKIAFFNCLMVVAPLMAASSAAAQTADQAWLKYRALNKPLSVPTRIAVLGSDPLEQAAAKELERGLLSMAGRSTPDENNPDSIVMGTEEQMRRRKHKPAAQALAPEEFVLSWSRLPMQRELDITGGSDRALLYAAFAVLRNLAQGADLSAVSLREKPAMPIRWVDEWDNPDGSIERGYAGRSLFFEGGHVRQDLVPVAEYARLLASIGVNGCNINNVNAAPQLLDDEHLKEIARIADVMRPWGVRVAMSVAIASPQMIGGLKTYDPLDPAVKVWWAEKVKEIYKLIPDFAGFTVKADSEGQPGPASFGRTPADAA